MRSFSSRLSRALRNVRISKIWDTYSGSPLHSFPHNHIVRSVALSPTAVRLLTGGQEKKARIFDLGRPDAAPDFLGGDANTLCHEGTIKSVLWTGENIGVTAGEDGAVKCVSFRRLMIATLTTVTACNQMVGLPESTSDHEREVPQSYNVDGTLNTHATYRPDDWKNGGIHPGSSFPGTNT